MANSFRRQIRLFAYFLCGFLLSINAVLAFAVTYCPAEQNHSYSFSGTTSTGKTREAACKGLGKGVSWSLVGTDCIGTSEIGTVYAYYTGITESCPDGSTPVNHQCVCDPCKDKSGMYYNNGQFSPSNLAGGDGAFTGSTTGSSIPATFCIDSCQMSTENLEGGAAGGYWYGRGNPRFSGKSCDTSDVPGINKPPPSPEYDCAKAGKGFGYFNGTVICTDINNTKDKATNTKTTTNPDGSKTQVKTDTTVNCDGTVCTTTTTTTTTTIDANGTTTGTTTKTDTTTKDDPSAGGKGTKGDASFCADNPSSPMCKEGSFSGSCTSEPACDGDPVQCATARATWKTRCALEPTQQVMTQGQNILDGDQQASDALKKATVAMPTVDTTGGGSTGSCPADKQVPIGDMTLTIPFSSICAAADLMKIALLAVATFTAGMIIVGGIK